MENKDGLSGDSVTQELQREGTRNPSLSVLEGTGQLDATPLNNPTFIVARLTAQTHRALPFEDKSPAPSCSTEMLSLTRGYQFGVAWREMQGEAGGRHSKLGEYRGWRC